MKTFTADDGIEYQFLKAPDAPYCQGCAFDTDAFQSSGCESAPDCRGGIWVPISLMRA